MQNFRKILYCMLALLALCMGPSALADTAFSLLNGYLVQLDLETADSQAAIPVDLNSGILAAGPEGQLFALDAVGPFTQLEYFLATIDPATGAVGHRVDLDEGIEQPRSLAYTSDGTLWLLGSENLFALDPRTGAATQRVPVSRYLRDIAALGNQLWGLFVEPGGAVEVVRIDRATGELDSIAELDIPLGNLQCLAFESNGRMAWILQVSGFRLSPTLLTEEIFRLETGSWQAELASSRRVANPFQNLALLNTPTDIPTLSTAASVLLMLVVAAAALYCLRRIRAEGTS